MLLNGANKRTYTGRHIKFSEMKLIRTYDSKLLEKEEEDLRLELDGDIAFSEVIAELPGLLGAVLKYQVGEDGEYQRTEDREGEEKAMETEVALVRSQFESERLRGLTAASSSRA